MALKTFINGVSVNLTPMGKPPVTFVNSTKKRLIKGVTFVNGVKKVLWDVNRLRIDYINLANVTNADTLWPVGAFANADKVIYSSGENVNRLDVSNLANVTLDNKVANGGFLGFSSVDSTSSTAVYYAATTTAPTLVNQLEIDTATGGVSAANNSASLGANVTMDALVFINNKWINANSPSNSMRYIYVKDGATNVYDYQTVQSGVSISGWIAGCPNFTKLNATTAVGYYKLFSNNSTKQYIGEFTSIGVSAVSAAGVSYWDYLVDGDEIACAGLSGFGLYTKPALGNYTEVATIANKDAYHRERLIGKTRGMYYALCEPINTQGDQKYYLHVISGAGVLVEEIELNLTYSTAYSGLGPNRFVPQLSQTGYLVFGNVENGVVVRIQGY